MMNIVLALCFTLAAYSWQQSNSMIDSARRGDGKANVVIDVMSPAGTIERLLAESSLVTRGIVQSIRPRLSNDETIVVTEFEVLPVMVYKGTLAAASRPGPANPLIVQRPGGRLKMDGLDLRTRVNEFPENESLSVGDNVVLFLSPLETEPGKFRLVRGPFGAFRIVTGNVLALTKNAAARRGDHGWTIEEFEQEMGRSIK